MSDSDAPLYMIAVRLAGERAIVVGGGPVAGDKVEKLLACRARVSVVAPHAGERIRTYAAEGAIGWTRRAYEPGDLDGAMVVVAATDDPPLNQRVSNDARARGILVNVVDVPALSTFIAPAVTRHGSIAVAVSTSGASPALAKRMRDEIAERFGEPYARLAAMLEGLRPWARATLPTYDDRRAFFEGIVLGDPDPVELLRRGREDDVAALIERARLAVEQARTS